jgi:hypothetical protein
MCFSDFVADPIMKYNIGYYCCILVILHLAFNIT